MRGERHKDGCAAGGQAALDLDLAVGQRQAGHKPLLLLEVKAAQLTVMLLGDTDRLKHVVFQLLLGAPSVQHQKGNKKHTLILALKFLHKQKTLSFLHDLGEVCQDSRCFIFWEKEEAIHHDELLEHYLDGLKMLMSIGYELRIDTIKNHTEIPNRLSLEDLFLKIYQSMMNVSSTYSSQDYQNTIDFSVQPANFVTLTVTECEPGVRGDTATGANKPATVETGLKIVVPLFVNEGDKVRIDTRTGEYMERV